MKLNSPTAKFFTAVHYLYDGDIDAVGIAYDLVLSTGFTGFGRERRELAIFKIAPDLALALSSARVDLLYIYAEEPRRAYKIVVREITRAEKWINENGTVPAMCVALQTPLHGKTPYWPDGWRYWVWALVNQLKLSPADKVMIPLYKEAREGLN
jgi:hypothetical protein